MNTLETFTTTTRNLGTVTITLNQTASSWTVVVESTMKNGLGRIAFKGMLFTLENSGYGREALAVRRFGQVLNQYGLSGDKFIERADQMEEDEEWEPIPVFDVW